MKKKEKFETGKKGVVLKQNRSQNATNNIGSNMQGSYRSPEKKFHSFLIVFP